MSDLVAQGSTVPTIASSLSTTILTVGQQLDVAGVDPDRWSHVVRQMYIISAIGDDRFVAVAGSQGAGKTSLVRNLYPGAAGWLESNVGRGEKNPVVIVERTGLTAPRGVVVRRVRGSRSPAAARSAGDDHALTTSEYFDDARRHEWIDIVQGEDSSVLLVKLEVPPTFWGQDGIGFVLLPGLERTKERFWQHLVRLVLSLSPTAVVVTDETRMAQATQTDLIASLRREHGADVELAVAVSRCEGAPQEVVEERRVAAAKLYDVDIEKVVAIGADPASPPQWTERLTEIVNSFPLSSASARRTKSQLMYTVMNEDVFEVIRAAKSAEDAVALDDGPAELLDQLLEIYEDSCDELRKSLRRDINKHFTQHHSDAQKRLQEGLEEQGTWAESFRRRGEWLRLKGNDWMARLSTLVDESWNKAAAQRTALDALDSAADERWRSASGGLQKRTTRSQLDLASAVRRSGPELLEEIDRIGAERHPLPALVQALPAAALAVRSAGIQAVVESQQSEQSTTLSSRLNELPLEQREVLGALGLLLGGDLLDGDADLLTAGADVVEKVLSGLGLPGASAAVSTLFATGVAAAVAGVAIIQQGNKKIQERDAIAEHQMVNLRRGTEESVLQNVDEILRVVKNALEAEFQTKFGVSDSLEQRMRLRATTRELENARNLALEALADDHLA